MIRNQQSLPTQNDFADTAERLGAGLIPDTFGQRGPVSTAFALGENHMGLDPIGVAQNRDPRQWRRYANSLIFGASVFQMALPTVNPEMASRFTLTGEQFLLDAAVSLAETKGGKREGLELARKVTTSIGEIDLSATEDYSESSVRKLFASLSAKALTVNLRLALARQQFDQHEIDQTALTRAEGFSRLLQARVVTQAVEQLAPLAEFSRDAQRQKDFETFGYVVGDFWELAHFAYDLADAYLHDDLGSRNVRLALIREDKPRLDIVGLKGEEDSGDRRSFDLIRRVGGEPLPNLIQTKAGGKLSTDKILSGKISYHPDIDVHIPSKPIARIVGDEERIRGLFQAVIGGDDMDTQNEAWQHLKTYLAPQRVERAA